MLAPASAAFAAWLLFGYFALRNYVHVAVFWAWAELDGVATLPPNDAGIWELGGPRELFRHWNVPMRAWLLRYVMLPVAGDGARRRGARRGASLRHASASAAVFLVSVLWHSVSDTQWWRWGAECAALVVAERAASDALRRARPGSPASALARLAERRPALWRALTVPPRQFVLSCVFCRPLVRGGRAASLWKHMLWGTPEAIDTALAAYAYLGLVAAMFVHLRPPRQPQPLLAPLMRQLRWAGGDAAKNDS